MSEFIVRSYNDNDRNEVIRLWSECGLVVPQNNPERDIERKLKVNPEWFLVGEYESSVIATCIVGYEGHRGWINYLAVSSKYQRQGFAAKIMQEAENMLREAGCPKINLQVRTSNSDVIQFYTTIGFTEDNVVSMGKRLIQDSEL